MEISQSGEKKERKDSGNQKIREKKKNQMAKINQQKRVREEQRLCVFNIDASQFRNSHRVNKLTLINLTAPIIRAPTHSLETDTYTRKRGALCKKAPRLRRLVRG